MKNNIFSFLVIICLPFVSATVGTICSKADDPICSSLECCGDAKVDTGSTATADLILCQVRTSNKYEDPLDATKKYSFLCKYVAEVTKHEIFQTTLEAS